MAKDGRHRKPEGAELPDHEEAVVALPLIEGHEDASALGRAQLAAIIAGEEVSLADSLEAHEPGKHLESVAVAEAVPVPDLNRLGQALRGSGEALAGLRHGWEAGFDEDAGLGQREPDGRLAVVHRTRILVLPALEAERDVPFAIQVIEQRVIQVLLETQHVRHRETKGEAPIAKGVHRRSERRTLAGCGMQVQTVYRAAGSRRGRVDLLQQLSGFQVFGVLERVRPSSPEGRDLRRGPVPVEIGIDEAVSARHRRQVSDETDDLAPHWRPLGLEAGEDLLQSPKAGRLVAVKGGCAQQRRPGGLPDQLADYAIDFQGNQRLRAHNAGHPFMLITSMTSGKGHARPDYG